MIDRLTIEERIKLWLLINQFSLDTSNSDKSKIVAEIEQYIVELINNHTSTNRNIRSAK